FAGLTGQGRSTGFAVAPPAQGMALPAPAAPLLATSAPVVVPASAAYVDTPAAGTLARADDLPAPAAARAQTAAPTLALPVPNQPLPASEPPRPSLATAARPSLASTGNPVLDELRELQSETSSQTGVAAAYRTRDGEAGLGQLDDLQVPMEGRFSVGDGKLRVAVTPTILDAGTLGLDYGIASRFGGGPQAALAGALSADREPVDELVGSSLFQTLLTRGDTNATRNLIYDAALASGRFQELFNQTDGALTNAERRTAALAALYQEPLP